METASPAALAAVVVKPLSSCPRLLEGPHCLPNNPSGRRDPRVVLALPVLLLGWWRIPVVVVVVVVMGGGGRSSSRRREEEGVRNFERLWGEMGFF